MKITKITIILISLVFAVNAQQQNATKTTSAAENPFQIFNEAIKKGDYLSPLITLQRDEFTKSAQWKGVLPDLLAYLHSYAGDYQTAYAHLDRQRERLLNTPNYKDVTSSPIDEFAPQTAVETIASLAGKNQVMMINEEHDTPLHRAFTTRLLPVLYEKGFRYLAMETLSEDGDEIHRRGYPTHKTGFYSNDPVYGEMIRTALRLGFKLIPYEYSSEKLIECRNQQKSQNFCQNERERGQAQNLYDRIFKDDPQAKVLVHVGRGHNQQLKMEDWAMMAWHFNDISGIKPLSINQMLSERSEPKYESGLYRYVANKWKFSEPVVFRSKDGKYFDSYGYDLAVFHPRSVYKNGRPVWLGTGGRKIINLYQKNKKLKQAVSKVPELPIMIQAFYANESEDAIPVDQIIVRDKKQTPFLALPNGKFRIRTIDAEGKIVGEQRLTN